MSNEEFDIGAAFRLYEKSRLARKAEAKSLRGKIMTALVAAGAKSVTVSFDGYGDSGEVGDPAVAPKEAESVLEEFVPDTPHEASEWVDGKVNHQTRDRTVAEAIAELCYALLENHGGWEINEGSFGEFTIDPAADEINLTFNRRVETYETDEETY